MYKLIAAVAYIHQQNVIHRDIKPQNLLITRPVITATDSKTSSSSSSPVGCWKDAEVKLADFGLARTMNVPLKSLTDEVVTLWYRPPDVLLGSNHYDNKIDIWSIGCVFAELITGKALFPGATKDDQLSKIFAVFGTPTEAAWPGWKSISATQTVFGPRAPLKTLAAAVSGIGKTAYDLLSKMLVMNPAGRIAAADALAHPFFDDVRPTVVAAMPTTVTNAAVTKPVAAASVSKPDAAAAVPKPAVAASVSKPVAAASVPKPAAASATNAKSAATAITTATEKRI